MSDDKDWERQKYADEVARRAAERAHDRKHAFVDRLASIVSQESQGTLKILLLMNGGAALAILAFVGALLSKKEGVPIGEIRTVVQTLFWFAAGVVLSEHLARSHT
jgi:hypothetical protein